MKREIKFRAWDKVANKMGFVTNIEWLHEESIRYILMDWDEWDDSEGPDLGFNIARVEEDVNLMQFTGLKDKNGREIYEGDIIAGYAGNTEVIWDDTGSGFDPFTLPGLGGHEWDRENPSDVEVIGNIYENPELLKQI